MDKLNVLINKLADNYADYTANLLKQDKITILLASYETAIKGEMTNYCNFGILSSDMIDKLLSMDNPLEFLYQEYLKSDVANIINEFTILFQSL